MANPNKAKGTRWENDCAAYLGERGITAKRLATGGSQDKGDLWSDGFTWQCKNHKAIALAEWVDAVEEQADNAGERHGVVLVKRRNHSVGRGYAVMSIEQMARLAGEIDHLRAELAKAEAVADAFKGGGPQAPTPKQWVDLLDGVQIQGGGGC